MRIGGKSNKGIKNIATKLYEDYQAIKRNKIDGILTLFLKNIRKLNQFFVHK